MNYAFQILMNRRSVRSYKPDPVPRNVLERIMETVAYAPSSRGRQPWHFSVVTDVKLLQQIREVAGLYLDPARAVIVELGGTKDGSQEETSTPGSEGGETIGG